MFEYKKLKFVIYKDSYFRLTLFDRKTYILRIVIYSCNT